MPQSLLFILESKSIIQNYRDQPGLSYSPVNASSSVMSLGYTTFLKARLL